MLTKVFIRTLSLLLTAKKNYQAFSIVRSGKLEKKVTEKCLRNEREKGYSKGQNAASKKV